MNLKDLIAKMTAIETGLTETAFPNGMPPDSSNGGMEECGDAPMMSHPTPSQPDNVTMNVSMNGQGQGGIRDLMDILRNLDKEADHDHEEPIMGDIVAKMKAAHEGPEIEMGEELGDDGETYGNSVHGDAGSHVHGIDAVTASGNDLSSKGKASPLSTAPGTNPLRGAIQEGLVDKLQSHYEEIKMREGVFSNIGQAVGNVAQGVRNAVSDVQQGYQQATAPAQGAPATAAPAKPAVNPQLKQQMVAISQQLASGAIDPATANDQLMKIAQQMKASGQALPKAPGQAAQPTAYKNVSGMSDKDW